MRISSSRCAPTPKNQGETGLDVEDVCVVSVASLAVLEGEPGGARNQAVRRVRPGAHGREHALVLSVRPQRTGEYVYACYILPISRYSRVSCVPWLRTRTSRCTC
ncbi:hypothetical protein HCTV5_166 [Halovirus HCTV-5]|uniref:hypothetical protein n=1 Tax=Halovirus HCTV-5 TaxID=1273748 RepID=UPI0003348522|nr:hypothetical protein M200_gp061 [Halovirus HCTV-5]AGM11773.1 hypothetical protein HCTV5_166 [Halovirus HCTV-5]